MNLPPTYSESVSGSEHYCPSKCRSKAGSSTSNTEEDYNLPFSLAKLKSSFSSSNRSMTITNQENKQNLSYKYGCHEKISTKIQARKNENETLKEIVGVNNN